MLSSHSLQTLTFALLPILKLVNAYSLVQSYDSSNFFNEFSFFTGGDPTNGFVDYVSESVAQNEHLASYQNGQVILGVDDWTNNPSGGRQSVRLSSNQAFTHGLVIGDFEHIPGSVCGSWPAFWMFGPNWPGSGEIDIIEGVNDASTNTITLHSNAGCSVSTSGSLGGTNLLQSNCNAGNGGTGCGVSTSWTGGYGNGFNSNGGGVYAMEWTSSHISVWAFSHGSVPGDISSGGPNPSGWGTPTVVFTGCDFDSYFKNHNIIFDITFCGGWAGEVWSTQGSCGSLAPSCQDYVANNPGAFSDTYWTINSVKVYQ